MTTLQLPYTVPCACGRFAYVGTNGFGYAVESCESCGSRTLIERGLPSSHPAFAEYRALLNAANDGRAVRDMAKSPTPGSSS